MLFIMLPFIFLYINGNIFFNTPTSMYNSYTQDLDIDNIIRMHKNDKVTRNVVAFSKIEMINDINSSTKLTSYEKRKIIIGIRYVKIIVTDLNYGNNEFLKKLNGLYITPKKHKKVRYILISDKLNDFDARLTLLHELFHLKDDILVDGDDFYSGKNVLNVLDMDLTNDELSEKVDNLIFLYQGGKREGRIDTKSDIILAKVLHDAIYEYIVANPRYITSPSEVYTRIWMMRKFLLEHGQISDMNQKISADNIKYLLNPEIIITNTPPQFFELLFLMDIDISKDRIIVNCLNDINKIP
jgi:hypothetical protein